MERVTPKPTGITNDKMAEMPRKSNPNQPHLIEATRVEISQMQKAEDDDIIEKRYLVILQYVQIN